MRPLPATHLTFSGSGRLGRQRDRFESLVGRIIRAEGFTLNQAKSTIQRRGGRQSVTGVVVNAHPNIRRDDYDRLKATLHNAVTHGPGGQNRAGVRDYRAHLRGRVAWVEAVNPARGAKLHRLFDQIDWP